MKAAVIRGIRNIVIEDRPIPAPKEGQVLVRIRAIGICGSDIRGFTEENSKARQPGLIIGHEAAGEVVELGRGATKFSAGDRVVVDPQVFCRKCFPCRNGWTSVCDNKKLIGSSLRGFLDGAMAEYAVVAENQLYHLPDLLGFAEGATVEPVSNALHAVARADIKKGDTAVVIGAGTLGLCILQAAASAGAGKIIVIGSSSEKRMTLARELGADVVLKARDADTETRIRELTDGKGADVVIDAAGNEQSLAQAVSVLRKRGKLVAFGNAASTVTVNLMGIINKELEIIGSSGANEEVGLAIEYLASKRMNVDPIITHTMKIEDTQRAFELLLEPKHEAIKIIITP
ncbi:MAG: alcohol dehydrogenase catalytic domain-containing protein [Treponemataceae bacterium]